jgi:hypothetical protein
MKRVSQFLILLLFVLFISCGKSEKQQAADRLQLAESLYQKGDPTGALAQADSIVLLYRREAEAVKAADQFRKKVYGDLLYRKQDELDTLKNIIASLEENFIPQQTGSARHVQYTHKKQDAEKRWNKSYIQVHLDGKGEMSISSNYYGDTWLDHTGIRVYDGDLQARTDTVSLDNVLNHHADFMDTKWEKVTYTGAAGKEVVDFIVQHANQKLKAVFLGKRHYYIILEEFDKQAIIDAYYFSQALRRKATLEKEIDELKSKV